MKKDFEANKQEPSAYLVIDASGLREVYTFNPENDMKWLEANHHSPVTITPLYPKEN